MGKVGSAQITRRRYKDIAHLPVQEYRKAAQYRSSLSCPSTRAAKAKRADGDYDRLRNYGLSQQAYQELLSKQDGKCAICREGVKLVVDHCHTTGVVRGLLCTQCNTGIGMMRDDVTILEAATEYLQASRKKS